jgi:hypothetical protein
MKLVREHIFEKFEKESDSIHDMGIGINVKKDFNSNEEFVEFMFNILPFLLKTEKIPDDIIKGNGSYFNYKYFKKMHDYTTKYITINGDPLGNRHFSALYDFLKHKGFKDYS